MEAGLKFKDWHTLEIHTEDGELQDLYKTPDVPSLAAAHSRKDLAGLNLKFTRALSKTAASMSSLVSAYFKAVSMVEVGKGLQGSLSLPKLSWDKMQLFCIHGRSKDGVKISLRILQAFLILLVSGTWMSPFQQTRGLSGIWRINMPGYCSSEEPACHQDPRRDH